MRQRKTKSFWHRIRFKYKLSFINEGTLEEVWSFRLSKLSAFVTFCLFLDSGDGFDHHHDTDSQLPARLSGRGGA